MPQRTNPRINHSSNEDEENLTPEDLSDASKTIDADDNSRFESSQSTTRLNVGLQRLGPHNSSRNTTKEFPKPQRASAYPKTKYGHPLSPLSSPIKTPERPMNRIRPLPPRSPSPHNMNYLMPQRAVMNSTVAPLTPEMPIRSQISATVAPLSPVRTPEIPVMKTRPPKPPSIAVKPTTPEKPQGFINTKIAANFNPASSKTTLERPLTNTQREKSPSPNDIVPVSAQPCEPRPGPKDLVINGKLYKNLEYLDKGGSGMVYKVYNLYNLLSGRYFHYKIT